MSASGLHEFENEAVALADRGIFLAVLFFEADGRRQRGLKRFQFVDGIDFAGEQQDAERAEIAVGEARGAPANLKPAFSASAIA